MADDGRIHIVIDGDASALKKALTDVKSPLNETDKQAKAVTDAVYYKVKKGDTLGKIAQKHHTTVNAICRLNGISSKKVLRIGQRLRVR